MKIIYLPTSGIVEILTPVLTEINPETGNPFTIDEIAKKDIPTGFKYKKIEDKAMQMVKNDDRPLKIINAPNNISAAIMRLQNFDNRFLYVVKYLDKDISNYLVESQEAINFYYTVEEKSTGIKISFAIIYLIMSHY